MVRSPYSSSSVPNSMKPMKGGQPGGSANHPEDGRGGDGGSGGSMTGCGGQSSWLRSAAPRMAAPPGGLPIESATTTTNSRQLTVTFTGTPQPGSKPCGADYSTEAVESASAVVVIVIEHPYPAGQSCAGVGARRTTTVDLAQPLGERAVLEVQQGLPVLLTLTA
jgi:hypothetical protein